MKKVPLFDLGNVVIRFSWEPFLSWLRERTRGEGRPAPLEVTTGQLHHVFESGGVGREEFARCVAKLYGAEFTQAEFEAAWCSIFLGPVAGMEELLRELRREGPVYALSNTNEVHLGFLVKQYPSLFAPFTRIFASHEMFDRKPAASIYRSLASALNLEPASLVFFDDVEANVAGARAAGLDAHLFRDTGEARLLLKGP